MHKKFYTEKLKDLKLLGQIGLVGLIGAILLYLINLICVYFFNFAVSLKLLAVPAVFFAFLLPRTLFLMFFPILVIKDSHIKYFNLIWYKKLKWSDFDFATLNETDQMIKCKLQSGRMLIQIDMANLSKESKDEIITLFKARTNLKTISKED